MTEQQPPAAGIALIPRTVPTAAWRRACRLCQDPVRSDTAVRGVVSKRGSVAAPTGATPALAAGVLAGAGTTSRGPAEPACADAGWSLVDVELGAADPSAGSRAAAARVLRAPGSLAARALPRAPVSATATWGLTARGEHVLPRPAPALAPPPLPPPPPPSGEAAVPAAAGALPTGPLPVPGFSTMAAARKDPATIATTPA